MTDGAELERSAARLAVDAVAIMNRARETAGLTQRELAARLDVGESRVSQVLHGDGNVRVATLARVLRASGYRVRLDVQPVDPDTPVIPRPAPRRRRTMSVSRSFEVGADVPDVVPASWSHAKVEVLVAADVTALKITESSAVLHVMQTTPQVRIMLTFEGGVIEGRPGLWSFTAEVEAVDGDELQYSGRSRCVLSADPDSDDDELVGVAWPTLRADLVAQCARVAQQELSLPFDIRDPA